MKHLRQILLFSINEHMHPQQLISYIKVQINFVYKVEPSQAVPRFVQARANVSLFNYTFIYFHHKHTDLKSVNSSLPQFIT